MAKSNRPRPANDFNPDDLLLPADDLLFPAADNLTLNADDDDDLGPLPSIAEAERIAENEVSDVLKAFREADKREAKRFDQATDSEYWFALGFQTREQKEEFLTKVGWMEIGDKYLDGMECAEVLGITLESEVPPVPEIGIDRKLAALARPNRPPSDTE